MRKLALLVTILFLATACAAVTDGTSRRIIADARLPAGVPQRVILLPFKGNPPVNYEATDRFAAGLPAIGFSVERTPETDAITARLDLDTWEVDEGVRKMLAEKFGAQAVFLGLLDQERGRLSISSRLQVRMFELPSGRLLWTTHTKSYQAAMQTGDIYALAQLCADEALKRLQKDMHEPPPQVKK